ncbi:TetR/AcrR family transcriptional regulator [Deinococcus sp.]|uniref:TetR/AcrR family transcriptional regulator n=1 Tax=Deinococcus sp. TaxID=47478 RepID=UPI003CC61909
MGRWENNARSRLEAAALELYSGRGFEQTTVAEIAARAGLTERTYFRHFADKREVLFGGGQALREFLVQQVNQAPQALAPLEAVVAAFEALDFFAAEQRGHSRQRQRLIEANAALHERELMKLAQLSAALREVLRQRGTPGPAAAVAAEVGMAIFKLAFERWTEESNEQAFAQLVRDALSELRAVVAGD